MQVFPSKQISSFVFFFSLFFKKQKGVTPERAFCPFSKKFHKIFIFI
jgi:hypothetical protein